MQSVPETRPQQTAPVNSGDNILVRKQVFVFEHLKGYYKHEDIFLEKIMRVP